MSREEDFPSPDNFFRLHNIHSICSLHSRKPQTLAIVPDA